MERGAFQSWLPLHKEMEPIAQPCGMGGLCGIILPHNSLEKKTSEGHISTGSFCFFSLTRHTLHPKGLLSSAHLGCVSFPP